MTMTCEEPAFTICLNEEEESPVKKVVSDLVSYASSLVVSTESEYKSMTSVYRKAKDLKKVVESLRKKLTEPLRNELARINDKAKEVTEPLDEVIELANAKTGATFLLASPYSKDEVWNHLPDPLEQTIIDKKIKLYVIDAVKLAEKFGCLCDRTKWMIWAR